MLLGAAGVPAELTHVYVEPGFRRRGLAHKMVARLCAHADRHLWPLVLRLEPYEPGLLPGLTTAGLMRLYGLHGFRHVGRSETTMYRKPV